VSTSLESKISEGLDALSNEYDQLSFRPAGPSRAVRAAVALGTCGLLGAALWAGASNRHEPQTIGTASPVTVPEVSIDLNQTVAEFYREPFSEALGFETAEAGEHSNQIVKYFSTYTEVQINACLVKLPGSPHIANWSRNGKPAEKGPSRFARMTLGDFRAQYGVAGHIFGDSFGESAPRDPTAIDPLDPRVFECSKDLPESPYKADHVAVNQAFSRVMLGLKTSGVQAELDNRFTACAHARGLYELQSVDDAFNTIEAVRGTNIDAEQIRAQDMSRHYAKVAGDCFNQYEAGWTAAIRPLEQAFVDANPELFTRLREFIASIDNPQQATAQSE
jgi:hypothetical protein